MANYDGSIRISTEMDNSKFDKGAEHVEKKLDTIEEKVRTGPPINWKEYAEKTAEIAAEVNKNVAAMDENNSSVKAASEHFNLLRVEVEKYTDALKELETQGKYYGDEDWNKVYIRLQDALYAVKQYKAELDAKTEEGMAKAAAKATREAEKQEAQQRKLEEIAERKLQREAQMLEKQVAQEAKLKAEEAEQERLEQIRETAVVKNQDLLDLLNEQERVLERMADLEKAGVAEGYQEYSELEERLAQIREGISDIRNGFSEVEDSSKKCFRIFQRGTKSTNGLLATMRSRLKGVALSLFVFNWLRKGFRAMVSGIEKGFQNLAQYSKEYNNAMSEMKSGAAELKNSIAAAFEPIVTAVIPYITQLISWLNHAANSMSRFLALIRGKSSYTKAKKQVVDYAKTLKSASDSAKGALAAFDELNVLKRHDSDSGLGGEVTGADAFESVAITQEDYEWLELVKDRLSAILALLMVIGATLSVFKVSGPIVTFISALTLILSLLEFIVHYMEAWSNGISFDNFFGMLQGLLGIFLAIRSLFGPFAAGLALVVGGIALIVLAIKDMIENGVNAQNCFTLLIGTIVSLVGIFKMFGLKAVIVIAGIVAVFAGLIAIAGNAEEAIYSLKSMFKNFGDFFKKLLVGDMKGAMESLKFAAKDLANVFIIAFESLINCIIKGFNWLIEKISGVFPEIPEWVPFIGGEKLEPVSEISLPRLATGGITNGPTRAIIGESGREAVLPLENNTEWMDVLADKINGSSNINLVVELDGRTVYSRMVQLDRDHVRRTGSSAFG